MADAVRKYAEGTSVPVTKTRQEIEATLLRYGATSFASGSQGNEHAVMFEANGRRVRFSLRVPDASDPMFTYTPARIQRTDAQREHAAKAEERRRWRSLAMSIKSKLDVVESDISTFEEEFGMFVVLPDGSTAADHVLPAIESAYATGSMPPMLGLGAGS